MANAPLSPDSKNPAAASEAQAGLPSSVPSQSTSQSTSQAGSAVTSPNPTPAAPRQPAGRASALLGRLGFALEALAWLALLLAALALRERWPAWSTDLSNTPWGEPSAAEIERLQQLPGQARLTYYVSGAAQLPPALRRLPAEIEGLLGALEGHSQGRLRWRRFEADSDEEARRLAADNGVVPLRRRQVEQDGWSETSFYSSIEVELLGSRSLVLNGIGPEQLTRLPSLLLQHLTELSTPRPPRFGILAPAEGFDQLRNLLRNRGELKELSPEAITSGGLQGLDALLLLDPPRLDAELAHALLNARERGQAQLLALQLRRATLGQVGGEAALQFQGTGIDPDVLLQGLGLSAADWPLFDGRSEVQGADENALALPFLLRAIAPNQDFRSLGRQPNGSLLFPTPVPLLTIGARLEELQLEATPLVTSSELSFTVPGLERAGLELDASGRPSPSAPIRLSSLTPAAGRPLAKQNLLLRLVSADPWQGEAFVSASARPFADEFFGLEGYAHRRLTEILVDALVRPERLVVARAELPRPAPLAALDAKRESLWRLAAYALLPGLLLLVSLWRGGYSQSKLLVGGARRFAALGLGLGLLLALGTLLALVPRRMALETSADPHLALASETLEQARAAVAAAQKVEAESAQDLGLGAQAGGSSASQRAIRGLELEWIATPAGRLPAHLRAAERLARQKLRDLEALTPGLRLQITNADAGDGAQLAALAARGVTPFPSSTEGPGGRSRREVFLTLLLRHGGAQEQLDFPDGRALEDFEFRLACACWRLAGNARPQLALASDTPRLSPAEAHTEYQQRRLFAPVGSDVYSLARASLERLDFDVQHVDPASPEIPEGTDALFWLQPRRPTEAMLAEFARYLYAGGRGFLAQQHVVLQPQAHRGRGFELVYWPQPQFIDTDDLWLKAMGVSQPVAVWFDRQNFDRPLVNFVNLDAEQRAYVKQEAALPFLMRISSAYLAEDPALAGAGDQALPFPSPFELAPQVLAQQGLVATVLMRTSSAAWSWPWQGGFVPPEVLTGPSETAPAAPEAPLYVRLVGQFPPPPPAPDNGGQARIDPLPAPGELLLLGATEALKNEALLDARFRGDRLLGGAAASLTLPPDLAALYGRRAAPRGLYFVEPDTRLAWRAGVLLLPLLLLPVGWSIRRRSTQPIGRGTP